VLLAGIAFGVSTCLALAADTPCKSKGTDAANCKKPHVITNDDLENPRARSASVVTTGSARPASPSNEQPANRDGSSAGTVTVDGLITGGSVGDAQKLLQDLKRDEQTLVRRYEQIEAKLVNEQDEQMRRLYTESLSRRDQSLANKRDQIRQVETAIQAAESGK
jgi:hypothetical protein